MAFSFSSTAGTSGITSITVSASSRQELTDIVENFTLANQTKSLLMPIAQRAYEPVEKYIIMSPSAITWASSGGTASLNIQSNDNWTIVASGWIRLSRYEEHRTLDLETPNTLSGNGNTIIGISCVENLGEARNGGITAYCQSDSSITATTTVSQAGNYVKPYLILDKYIVNIPESGMSGVTIVVDSNVDWMTSTDSRWIDIDTISGSSSGTIVFDVSHTDQSIERRGSIYVSGITDDVSAECVVAQSTDTQEPYIVISPTYQNVQLSGGSFSITVSSNTDWDVAIIVNGQSGDARTWLTVDKLNGYGDDIVEVTVNPMLSGTERTAYISFYNNIYALKVECNITQKELDGKKLYYTSTDDNIITPYTSNGWGANIIDNTYENGQGIIWFDGDVTSIPDRAFTNESRLLTIVLPYTTENVGKYAVANCQNLEELTIPENVSRIDSFAFSNNTGLSVTYFNAISSTTVGNMTDRYFNVYDSSTQGDMGRLVIGNEVIVIPEALFEGAKFTGDLVIPDSVVTIEKDAFNGGLSFSGGTLTLGNSLTSIGSGVFYGSHFVGDLRLPSSIRSVSGGVFSTNDYATMFTGTLYIPSSLTSCTTSSFAACAGVDHIIVENGSIFKNGNWDALIIPSSNTLLLGCKNTTIPNDVLKIRTGAFANCTGLTSITIPSSVDEIGNAAFQNCTDLTTVAFEEKTYTQIVSDYKYLKDFAFRGCTSLSALYVNMNYDGYLPPITSNAFDNVPSGGVFHYPNGINPNNWKYGNVASWTFTGDL